MSEDKETEGTDLELLKALSDWLADDNEVPGSGDAALVMDAIDEIKRLRDMFQLSVNMVRMLESKIDRLTKKQN